MAGRRLGDLPAVSRIGGRESDREKGLCLCSGGGGRDARIGQDDPGLAGLAGMMRPAGISGREGLKGKAGG